MILRSLILANLTKADFTRFYNAHIDYSGMAGNPNFDSDPTPWGRHAPYIATSISEFLPAISALKWKDFSMEVNNDSDQLIVSRVKK